MKTIDIAAVLGSIGIDINKYKGQGNERAPQFLEYCVDIGGIEEVVMVESTARSVTAEILCLPMDVQVAIFVEIAHRLEYPGEQAFIVAGDKPRSVRVVRIKPEPDDDAHTHRLLLTF